MSIHINGLFLGEIQPDVTIGGCIDIYENIWPNPEETIQKIETECNNPNSGIHWERATTIGQGAHQSSRTNKMLGVTYFSQVSNNPVCQNIHNQFNTLLLSTSIPYASRYYLNEGLWHEPYSILKYDQGEEYKPHYDGHTAIGRTISAVCYLNNDYEGGEIEFVHHKVKIKPEPGMLILFPSNFAYTHIAHPIKKGTKYLLVTWIKDRNI
jgi:hypothetical protein